MSSVANRSYERFTEAKFVERRNVIILGRTGVGKSGIFGCLCGYLDFQTFGLRHGTEKPFSKTIELDNYVIHIVDTVGWSGNEEEDLHIFQELNMEVQDDGARINRIYFVITAKRFTKIDQNILDFLERHASSQMKELVHVIVTHAPDFEQTEDLKALLKDKFRFLMKDVNDENEFKSKFTFVDLLDSRRFQKYPDTHQVVKTEWDMYRSQLLDIIKKSETYVPVRKFLQTSEVATWVRLKRQAILFSILVLTILVLIAVLNHFFLINWQLKKENQDLNEIVESIKNNVTEPIKASAKLIKGIVLIASGVTTGFETLSNGVATVFSWF